MTTTTLDRPTLARAPAQATPPRTDLYAAIHKGLRLFMIDTLGKLGWLDAGDPGEVTATLAQVRSLLEFCRHHLAQENQFVHPALESRRPGASLAIAGEHDDHLETIAALDAEAAALRARPAAAAAHRLYRHLALFVAENFEHMNVEETAHNAALWATHTDAEIQAVHQRLVASIAPAEMALALRWMVPAMSPDERAAMFSAMQQQMPPQAFQGALDLVRPHLGASGWASLARALGLSTRTGGVDTRQ